MIPPSTSLDLIARTLVSLRGVAARRLPRRCRVLPAGRGQRGHDRWQRPGRRPRDAPVVKLAQTTTPLDGDSASDTRRPDVGVRISIRTILLVAATVVVIAALASIRSVLLVIFVSVFSVAVLSPPATAMERRFGWSRRVCSMILVLAIV